MIKPGHMSTPDKKLRIYQAYLVLIVYDVNHINVISFQNNITQISKVASLPNNFQISLIVSKSFRESSRSLQILLCILSESKRIN